MWSEAASGNRFGHKVSLLVTMLGDEKSVFCLSEDRARRAIQAVKAKPPVLFAPELSIGELWRLSEHFVNFDPDPFRVRGAAAVRAARRAAQLFAVRRIAIFWEVGKRELERIDKELQTNASGEMVAVIPPHSFDWVDILMDAAESRKSEPDQISDSDLVKQIFEISLAIFFIQRLPPKAEIPPAPDFPISVQEFALIGAYRNPRTARKRLQEFLIERVGSQADSLVWGWERSGIREAHWIQFAEDWIAWSEQAMRKAKTRTSEDPSEAE